MQPPVRLIDRWYGARPIIAATVVSDELLRAPGQRQFVSRWIRADLREWTIAIPVIYRINPDDDRLPSREPGRSAVVAYLRGFSLR